MFMNQNPLLDILRTTVKFVRLLRFLQSPTCTFLYEVVEDSGRRGTVVPSQCKETAAFL
jgi:hypothetical protein